MARSFRLSLALTVLFGFVALGCLPPAASSPEANEARNDYLLCFWNLENFFDDKADHRDNKADREYDEWFAEDPGLLRLKLDHLSDALLKLNDGKGPDILAVAEVESRRAAELLQDALNQKLRDPALEYKHVLMKELAAGRHIAPAIITRLPVEAGRTRLHGSHLRILEGHVVVQGYDLVIVASHWTARVTDKTGEHRDKYGDQIYGLYRGMHRSNPSVDFLACGDFNDPPDAPSVTQHLHALEDPHEVLRSAGEPLLLDLFAGWSRKNRHAAENPGTHYYGRNWFIFDQIAVSPGLLDDRGWSCDPDSASIDNKLTRPSDRLHRPWRFGNPNDKGERGYSDHFPVTVRLRVNGGD
jgi:endonuclease/exonuclease/phosphatase family metal-dependent hydrolase